MAKSLQQSLEQTRQTLVAKPGAPSFSTPDESVDALTLYQRKREREARTTPGDYLGAMWRQDSPVDGVVAEIAGSQLTPDPSYAPFEQEEWKRLTEGIPDEFHHNFYKATSPAHALYMRERLLQKQDDLTKLGDLGLPGNAARIAFNLVEPASLAAGVASGGIFKVASGISSAARARRAAQTVGQQQDAAAKLATAAAREASGGAITAGVLGGAAGNAAFEKLRQSVNFEDDSAMVAEAALVGAIFSAPFVYLNAREMRRVAATANVERDQLGVLRKVHDGQPLDAEDLKIIGLHQEVTRQHRDANTIYVNSRGEAEVGQGSPTATNPLGDAVFVNARGDAAMSLPAREWIDDFRAQLRSDTERRLNEWFPGRGTHEPVKVHRLSPEERAKLAARVRTEDEAWLARKAGPGTPSAKVTLKDLEGGPEVRNPVLSSELGSMLKAKPARQAEFTKAVDELQARKERELDELQRTGNIAAGERELALGQTLDDVRAVRAEFEREHASRPDDEPVSGRAEGTDVLWSEGGKPDTGTVVQVMPNGKLKIDLYPSLPGTAPKTPGGSQRYRYMHRSELDPDSPLFEDVTPEGFGPNTVGGAQASGTSIPQSDVSPEFDSQTSRAKWRLDLFARLNKSTNPAVQFLAHTLIKDAIGNSKEWAQRWTASERKRTWQRVLGGRFHAEAKSTFNEVRRVRGIGVLDSEAKAKDFYEAVSRVVRGDADVLAQNQDIAPQLQRAAQEMRKVYEAMAEIARKSGLEGAEQLTPDGAYVNRIWNHDRIREMEQMHGADAVLEVLAGSINQAAVTRFKQSPRYEQMKASGKSTDADVRRAKATAFLAAVKKLEFSPALQDIHLMARDMKTLRETLRKEKLSDDQIDNIVDIMFEAKVSEGDAGNPTNLRFRFDLDETHTTQTGTGRLSLMDLMENDSRLLVDIYLNSMAGHAALADRGITSRAEFDKQLDDARTWYADNEQGQHGASRINEEIQMLEDIYAHITGRPMSMHQFNTADRVAGALRAWSRSAFLGQLGVAAAFEMVNAVALTSVRAFFQHSAGFRGVIQALRTGKVPDRQLSQQIEAWTGFGQEAAMSYARQNEITDFTYDRGLTRFENWGNKASHVVDVISGNRLFTSLTRQMSAAMFIQKHVGMAGRSLSAKQRERLVHQGVDANAIDDMLASLKAHTVTGQGGKVLELKWEDWKTADPKGLDTYLLVLNREVRDAIQEHDLGEVPMFMHTTLGKIFGELRTFMVAAHAKQFLKGMHYMDGTTMSLWMMSFVGQSLAYSMQTSINFAHNQAELDKRLSLERIAAAAVQRMGVMGVTPALLETGWYTATGGDSLFKHGGTANTDNRNLFLTPSMMVVNRALKGASVAAGAVNPFTDNIVTKQDVKDSLGVLPGGNTWLMRNLIDGLSSNFPKQEAPVARQ